MVGDGGTGRRLLVHVSHIFMNQWMCFGDREPPDRSRLVAELWRVFPPQPRTSLRCLQCAGAVARRGLFVNHEAAARCEVNSRAVD